MNEYGLDIDCFSNLRDIRFYPDLFGVCNARLISQFPLEYEKQVNYLINELNKSGEIGDNKKKKIREIYVSLKRKKCFYPINRIYDYTNEWSDNAITQHRQKPFHAMITSTEIDSEKWLNPKTFTSTDPLMQTQRGAKVERNAEEIAMFAEELLWMSNYILFVDPYFKGSELEKNEVLSKLLEKISNSEIEIQNRVIEYHVDDTKIPSTFEKLLNENVKPFIPKNTNITFITRPTKEMHNRFILTSEGGILLGQGLMEHTPMQPNLDNIGFLDFDEWQEEYRSHRDGTQINRIEL